MPAVANRALVAEFTEKVLVGADYSVLADYISTETYHQHNTDTADGLDDFGAAAAKWAEQGKNLAYNKVRQVIAEGEFGVPVASYDLFRASDGKIVEHWDVIAPVAAELHQGCRRPWRLRSAFPLQDAGHNAIRRIQPCACAHRRRVVCHGGVVRAVRGRVRVPARLCRRTR
jgi:predicted SnoaL-like aldol condensation-catalyzing enzyme